MPDHEDIPAVSRETQQINISDWAKKFSASEKTMKQEFKYKWQIARQRVRVDYDVKNRNSRKMTHQNVGLAYSIGQSFVNSVYFKAPNCNLTAREEVERQKVEDTEIKVNDWLKDKKIKRAVRRNIWDAYEGGFGARFIDYVFEDTEDPENILQPGSEAETDPMTGQIIREAVPPQLGRIVLKNEIRYQRIRPDLVRFPKGFDFDNYQESPWIGFEIIMPLEDVRNQKEWGPAKVKIEGEKYSKLSDSDTKESDESDDLYAKVSYVFIKPSNELEPFKLLVFCAKHTETPLLFTDYDKGHAGYPIKFLYFNPLDDDFSYPNGDVWNYEAQLSAVDVWWRRMFRHTEKASPKRIFDSSAISKPEAQNLKSNDDLSWTGIENKQKRPLGDLIQQLEAPRLHPDQTSLFEVARQLISELAPRSSLSRGTPDEKVDTATEAKIIQTGELIDVDARIDAVSGFISDIVSDVAGILEKSLQAELSVKREVIDEFGKKQDQIIQATQDNFTSKVSIDVDVKSMQAQNKDVFRRQLLDAVKFLVTFEPVMNKPSIDPNTGQVVLGKTIDPLFWLTRIFETMNIRNVEKGVRDLPPVVPGFSPPGTEPPSSIESGQNQETEEDVLAGRI